MFISEAAALSIVQEMKEITGHDINIMDGTGTIFASTDPGRVGQRHEGACQILSQKLPRLTVQEARRPGGIPPGVNLPIQRDGEPVGVIGIWPRRTFCAAPASAALSCGSSLRSLTRRSWSCGAICWGSTSPPAGPW